MRTETPMMIDYKNRFKFYFTSTMSSTMTVVVVHYSPASTHPPASTAPPPIAASFSVTHHFVSCCCLSLVWYSQTLGYCMTRHSASTIGCIPQLFQQIEVPRTFHTRTCKCKSYCSIPAVPALCWVVVRSVCSTV